MNATPRISDHQSRWAAQAGTCNAWVTTKNGPIGNRYP